jgi:hypothetical protein
VAFSSGTLLYFKQSQLYGVRYYSLMRVRGLEAPHGTDETKHTPSALRWSKIAMPVLDCLSPVMHGTQANYQASVIAQRGHACAL